MPAAANQTAHMVDLRAPDQVLAELADARRQFEKGAAAPVAVPDRFVELADALADSGPLELGVSPRRWVRTQGTMRATVAALQQSPNGPLSATQAKEAMGRLRRLMRLAAWSSRWRVRTRASRWAPFALFAFCALGLWARDSINVSPATVSTRYSPVSTTLRDPAPEAGRVAHESVCDAPCPADPPAHAGLGLWGTPVLQPKNATPDAGGSRILMSIGSRR